MSAIRSNPRRSVVATNSVVTGDLELASIWTGTGCLAAAGFVLAALVAATTLEAVTCSSGTLSPETPPATEHLRAYWGSLHGPAGLAADLDGTVYAADPARGVVVERRFDGRLMHEWSGWQRPVAVGVAADRSDPIFVADEATGEVAAFDRSFQRLFALGAGASEILSPSDIAVEPGGGRIFVSDVSARAVAVYDAAGTRIATLTGAPGDPFASPTGLARDPGSGEIVVADQVASRVHVFGPDLVWRRCLGRQGTTKGRYGYPFGVAIDGSGRLYVADAFQGRIQVVDRLGRHLAYVGEYGRGPGQLTGVADLVLDPAGRLFASSGTNGRLDLFGLDVFSDPERFAPLAVEVGPDALSLADGPDPVPITIRARGYGLAELALADVAVNGVMPLSLTVTDEDRDGVAEGSIAVGLAALLETLPPSGPGEVEVTALRTGLTLVGSDGVLVVPSDSDGDGVEDDFDACPGTVTSAVVDAAGCSLEQLCWCDAAWLNRGAYVGCVDAESARFLAEGRITDRERGRLLREAARSSCGSAGSR